MSEDLRYGVFITDGPANWQVIQQENGCADIYLEGKWDIRCTGTVPTTEEEKAARIYVRLFNERDNLPVINAELADHLPDFGWCCTLKNVPAGGPYRIETCLQFGPDVNLLEWSTHGDILHHVCVGDVYLIAGQSNAAGYGKDPIDDAPEIGVHMLREKGIWDLATHPLHDSTDSIFLDHQDGANTGHSPYLSFARKMKRKNGWPVGLIMAAKGGAPLDRFDPGGNGDLYRNMIEMVNYQGGKIRAVIWCQGCSDTNAVNSITYGERLKGVILQSRKDLNNENLPWFILQIGRFGDITNPEECDMFWGAVREQQRLLAHQLDNVCTISTIDSTTSDAVHNNGFSNMALGERVAGAVLNKLYGFTNERLCPDVIDAVRADDKKHVIVNFSNVIENLCGVHNQCIPVTVFRPDGTEMEIADWNGTLDKINIFCTEEVPDGSKVAGVWQAVPDFKPPFDSGTRLPILSFYDVEIK